MIVLTVWGPSRMAREDEEEDVLSIIRCPQELVEVWWPWTGHSVKTYRPCLSLADVDFRWYNLALSVALAVGFGVVLYIAVTS